MELPHVPAPEWKDVYHAMCQDIATGRLEPGDDLPTISGLARETGLRPHGARRVLERLCKEGRAQSWQGKGFRVAMPTIRMRLDNKSPVFSETIRSLGYAASSTFLSSKTIGMPADVAKRMRQRQGKRSKLTQTLRHVNDRPVALSLDYFAKDRLGDIDASLSRTGSVSRALSEHGISHYRRDFSELTCRFPTEHEAVMLQIPRTQPVYATIGANLAADGKAFQVSKGIWRADCVAYEY